MSKMDETASDIDAESPESTPSTTPTPEPDNDESRPESPTESTEEENKTNIAELILPESSQDLHCPPDLLLETINIYELIIRFHTIIRLSPFSFEDFCAALHSSDSSSLIAETFVALIRCLLIDLESKLYHLTPNDMKDSVNIVLYNTDAATYPSVLGAILTGLSNGMGYTGHGGHDTDLSIDRMECMELAKVLTQTTTTFQNSSFQDRLTVLTFLTNRLLYMEKVHESLSLSPDEEQPCDEKCRQCDKPGDVICCDKCPAVYHINCLQPVLDEIPEDDWLCPVCTVHQASGADFRMEKSLRLEPVGCDRHGRLYFVAVRRLVVVVVTAVGHHHHPGTTGQTWYYSSWEQLDSVISRLHPIYEESLIAGLDGLKQQLVNEMNVTSELTGMAAGSRRSVLHSTGDVDARILRYLFRLGDEANYLTYGNQFRMNPLALGRQQRQEEADRRRSVNRFAAADRLLAFSWSAAGFFGPKRKLVETLVDGLLKLEKRLPAALMNERWTVGRTVWLSAVNLLRNSNSNQAGQSDGELLAGLTMGLLMLVRDVRPVVFSTVWKESLGHTSLILQRKEDKSDEPARLDDDLPVNSSNDLIDPASSSSSSPSLFAASAGQRTTINYSLGLRHMIFKQRGEDYRIWGGDGWRWRSSTAPPIYQAGGSAGVAGCPYPLGTYSDGGRGGDGLLDELDELDLSSRRRALFLCRRVYGVAAAAAASAAAGGDGGRGEQLMMPTLRIDRLLERRLKLEDGRQEKLNNWKIEINQLEVQIDSLNQQINQLKMDKQLIDHQLNNNSTSSTSTSSTLSPIEQVINELVDKICSDETVKELDDGRSRLITDRIGQLEQRLYGSRLLIERRRRDVDSLISTEGKVFLPSFKPPGSAGKAKRMEHKFGVKSTNRKSIFCIDRIELKLLARKAGQMAVTGFKDVKYVPAGHPWIYPAPRPYFSTAWRFRVANSTCLADIASHLQVLWASIRWDELARDLGPSNQWTETTVQSIVSRQLIGHRPINFTRNQHQRQQNYHQHHLHQHQRQRENRFEYLVKTTTTPLDVDQQRLTTKAGSQTKRRGQRPILRDGNDSNDDDYEDYTTRRDGLRKRRVKTSDQSQPRVDEKWVKEDDLLLTEIRLYHERLAAARRRPVALTPAAAAAATSATTMSVVRAQSQHQLHQHQQLLIPVRAPVPAQVKLVNTSSPSSSSTSMLTPMSLSSSSPSTMVTTTTAATATSAGSRPVAIRIVSSRPGRPAKDPMAGVGSSPPPPNITQLRQSLELKSPRVAVGSSPVKVAVSKSSVAVPVAVPPPPLLPPSSSSSSSSPPPPPPPPLPKANVVTIQPVGPVQTVQPTVQTTVVQTVGQTVGQTGQRSNVTVGRRQLQPVGRPSNGTPVTYRNYHITASDGRIIHRLEGIPSDHRIVRTETGQIAIIPVDHPTSSLSKPTKTTKAIRTKTLTSATTRQPVKLKRKRPVELTDSSESESESDQSDDDDDDHHHRHHHVGDSGKRAGIRRTKESQLTVKLNQAKLKQEKQILKLLDKQTDIVKQHCIVRWRLMEQKLWETAENQVEMEKKVSRKRPAKNRTGKSSFSKKGKNESGDNGGGKKTVEMARKSSTPASGKGKASPVKRSKLEKTPTANAGSETPKAAAVEVASTLPSTAKKSPVKGQTPKLSSKSEKKDAAKKTKEAKEESTPTSADRSLRNGVSDGPPPPDQKQLLCICKTRYDRKKFYIGCDLCHNWFHGSCVGINGHQAKKLDTWICADCTKQAESIQQELYCICRTPYDESEFYIGCDSCLDWFHGRCVGISQKEAQTLDQWLCKKCSQKSTTGREGKGKGEVEEEEEEESRRSTKDQRSSTSSRRRKTNDPAKSGLAKSADSNKDDGANNNGQLTVGQIDALKQLVKEVRGHKMAWPFQRPVNPTEVPDYLEVVKDPISLLEVEDKLAGGRYRSLMEFDRDVALIFANCRLYNAPDTQYCQCANVLEKFYLTKLKPVRLLF